MEQRAPASPALLSCSLDDPLHYLSPLTAAILDAETGEVFRLEDAAIASPELAGLTGDSLGSVAPSPDIQQLPNGMER